MFHPLLQAKYPRWRDREASKRAGNSLLNIFSII